MSVPSKHWIKSARPKRSMRCNGGSACIGLIFQIKSKQLYMTDYNFPLSGREPSLSQPAASGQDVALGRQAAILSALDLLNHPDTTIRQRAAYQLAQMGDERVIDRLIEWLTDTTLYHGQRQRAAEALGKLKAKPAL